MKTHCLEAALFLLLIFVGFKAEAGGCDPPFLLTVNNIGSTEVSLDWTPMGSEAEWDVALLPAGSPPPGSPTAAGITSHPYTHTGLTPGTAYDFYLRAVCSGIPGPWTVLNNAFVTQLNNPSNCQLGLPIPDNGCTEFLIEVTSAPGSQQGIDVYLSEVRLIMAHDWDDDLDITLSSPSGISLILSEDNGGNDDNYGDPTDGTCTQYTALLSELAPGACDLLSITDAEAPFIGDFLSQEGLVGFNDGSNPVGSWELSVCDDALDDLGSLEFVELVFLPVTCPAPSLVEVIQVDSTFAVFDWTPGTDCSATLVEYGPPGFTPGTGLAAGADGTVLLAGCPPYTLIDLNSEAEYDIYFREDCGGGMYSNNSCPVSIQTPCSPNPVTSQETFDGQTACNGACNDTCTISGPWFNVYSDQMDWLVLNGPTPTTETGPDDDISGGGNYIYMEGSGTCSPNDQAILHSNCFLIETASDDTCHFSFQYMMYGATANALKLDISEDGGLTWSTIWFTEGDQGQVWQRQYLNLSAYEDQVVQFRFVAYKGLSARCDIALDQLTFYGAIDQGSPSFTYYADVDMDGFGDPATSVLSCLDEAPPGYVDNGDDCMDTAPEVNPDAEETPCDGFDANCNGMDDEPLLPPPATMHDTICSGDLGLVSATPAFGGMIVWYDSPTGGMPLDTGLSYFPQPPLENNSPAVVEYNFYAEEQNILGCYSPVRGVATILVNPQPDLQIPPGQLNAQCAGDTLDLADLIIQDLNNTDPTITFHDEFPPEAANELPSTQVIPLTTTYYYILAVSSGGCTAVDSVEVSVSPSPIASILGDTTICQNDSELLQVIDAGAGQGPYTYDWTTTANSASIEIFGDGFIGTSEVYGVTITDANGCSSSDSIEVEVITSIPSVSNSTQAVTSCGGSDGSISLTPGGGVGPFDYAWEGPQSGSMSHPGGTFVISGLQQGSYSVTITDNSPQACPVILPLLVVNGPDASVSIANLDDVSCNGAMDGCIELDVVGTAPSILWSTGATTETLCDLGGGFYSVTVTDGACENILSDIFVAEADSLVAKTTAIQHVSCFGGNDGEISILIGGGNGPYQFLWSNGAMTQNIDNLPADIYSLTVTDQNDCVLIVDSLIVEEPDLLQAPGLIDSISCPGFADGAIYLSVVGGTAPYAYDWNTGGNLSFLDAQPAGEYSVTVTDQNDCTVATDFTLVDPEPLTITLSESTDPSCAGLADGGLEVTVSGGFMPYSYQWSSGDTLATATGLVAGDYTLSITDAAACMAVSDTFSLEAPQAIQVDASIVPTTCLGIEDGSITLDPQSGQEPFMYEWSNGGFNATINDLAPGLYSVTITAANGCRDTLDYEVDHLQPLSTVTSIFPPICNGGNTGQIFLTAMGGTPSYSYTWSNGEATDDLDDLEAGGYVCTIEDAAGCLLITDTLEVVDPPLIEIELRGVDSISCFGASDGNIDMSVGGGVPPYLFTWSDESTSEDLFQVPAGTYILSVEDDLGCTVVGPSVNLPQPAPLMIEVEEVDENIECSGNIVDTLFINISGGTPAYAIEWSNGSMDPFLTGVPSGDYSVVVTDLNGCTLEEESIKYPEPIPPISLVEDTLIYEGISCDSLLLGGRIGVVVVGGFPPYQFNWNTGQNGTTSSDTITLEGLTPGFYYLTVTDDEGCVAELDSIQVTTLQELSAFVPGNGIDHVNCNGGSDGSIQLLVNGGASPYSFIWTNQAGDTVSVAQHPNNLPAGIYAVEVFDIAGCVTSLSGIQVNQPPVPLTLSATVEDILCFGDSSGFINLSVNGGLSPYTFDWSNGSDQEDISNLDAGPYSVTVTDKNDCAMVLDTVVHQPASPISLDSFTITQIDCFGNQNGAIDISISGGTPPYIHVWSNNKLTEDIDNLGPGFYDCFISDSLGCSFNTQDFQIQQPSQIQLVDLTVMPAYVDSMVGSIEVELTGGTPPYDYSWSNGDNGPLADSLAAGQYELEVLDAMDCPFTLIVNVPEDTIIRTQDLQFDEAVWKVWPNPAHNVLFVENSSSLDSEVDIELVDLLGRHQQAWQVIAPAGELIRLELKDHPPGVYWLRLDRRGSIRIIIQ